jgi:glutamyl-tRNA reductase
VRELTLRMVGLSHRTAPLAVRERFAWPAAQRATLVARIRDAAPGCDAVLLSTCNRTELYTGLPAGLAGGWAVRQLVSAAGLDLLPREHLYEREGAAVADHLFRVVAGLDSMILGEPQIQGQVKAAYEEAGAARGGVLGRLFQNALAAGGRVRGETGVGRGAASIPSAAVELARKVLGTLRGRRAVVVGTGEMGRLSLALLAREGVRGVVAGRRPGGACPAPAVGGPVVGLEQVPALLEEADLLISATAAPVPVLRREHFLPAVTAARRKRVVIDLAVPRDIEPDVGALPDVFLFDVDDLREVMDGALARRRDAAAAAERILAEESAAFRRWLAARDAAPAIRAMRDRAERFRAEETGRALMRMRNLSAADRAAVEALTRQLVNKLLHEPTVRLREAAAAPATARLPIGDAARYLFGIDDPAYGAAAGPSAAEEAG